MTIKLRDYQIEAVNAVQNALAKGTRRQVLNMATGLGKTICFAELLRQMSGPALVLAHRDELIQQAADKIRVIYSDVDLGIVKAEQNEWQAQVVVASVQSLHNKRLKVWNPDRFDVVVIDECHHAAAQSYRRIIDYLQPKLLLGVTATPFRGDKITLGDVFEDIVYSYGILDGIKNGYLVDIKAYRVRTGVDLDPVSCAAGDFKAGELEDAVNNSERNRLIVEAYRKHVAGKRALVFTVGVTHAQDLAQEFLASGISAAYVHGGMPLDQRRAVLRDFHTGRIQVVTNCNVLTEGFDEPAVEAIIMARPTKSLPLFTQMVGRGTRPSSETGKSNLTLLDIADNTARHRIITVRELFGLRGELAQGKAVTKAILEEEKNIPEVKEFLSAAFPEIILEEVPELLEEFADSIFLPDYDWRQILDDIRQLAEDEDAYQAALKEYETKWEEPGKTRPSDGQVAALSGFQWPEDQIMELTRFEASWCIDAHLKMMGKWREKKAGLWGTILNKPPENTMAELFSAPWQYKPATAKQLRLLKKKGVRLPPGELTAGEASIMIDRVLRGA